MTRVLQRFLLLWLTLLSALAFFWPDWFGARTFDPFLETDRRQLLGPTFAVAMFAIGSLLPRDEVASVLARWRSVLGGTAVQYASMPLLAYAVGNAFGLSNDLLIGVIVVGCVPGAMASNVLTLAAGGNTSFSVSLTTSATVLSPLVVPFTLWWLLGAEHDINPLNVLVGLLRTVVGPVVVGHLLSRRSESFATLATRIAPVIANLVILWIIAVVVAVNRNELHGVTVMVLGALLTLNLLGYGAGFLGGTALRLPDGMRRALVLEIGMQNAGLGTVLVRDYLFPDKPEALIPTAAYTFGCMLTGTLLAAIWSRVPAEEASSTP